MCVCVCVCVCLIFLDSPHYLYESFLRFFFFLLSFCLSLFVFLCFFVSLFFFLSFLSLPFPFPFPLFFFFLFIYFYNYKDITTFFFLLSLLLFQIPTQRRGRANFVRPAGLPCLAPSYGLR